MLRPRIDGRDGNWRGLSGSQAELHLRFLGIPPPQSPSPKGGGTQRRGGKRREPGTANPEWRQPDGSKPSLYRRLVNRKNGAALYGCWALVVQVAARSKPRGVLLGSDGPLTAEDLEAKTGVNAEFFVELFEAACEPGIGWLECVDPLELITAQASGEIGGNSLDASGNLQRPPATPRIGRKHPEISNPDKRTGD